MWSKVTASWPSSPGALTQVLAGGSPAASARAAALQRHAGLDAEELGVSSEEGIGYADRHRAVVGRARRRRGSCGGGAPTSTTTSPSCTDRLTQALFTVGGLVPPEPSKAALTRVVPRVSWFRTSFIGESRHRS
jgi:hypothetical protein